MTGRLDLGALEVFCRQTSSLVKSGLPLSPGLRAVAGGVRSEGLRRAVERLADACAEGTRLSDAMANSPGAFPDMYVRIVRAGEGAGNLALVLEQLAVHASRALRIKRAVGAALLYPKIVLIFTILLLSGIYIFVLPAFGSVFRDLGMRSGLPSLTETMLGWSQFLRANWWLPMVAVFLVVEGGVILGLLLRQVPPLRHASDRVVFSMPVLGDVMWLGEMARVCRILEVCAESQVPLPDALRLAAGSAETACVSQELTHVAEDVEAGEAFNDALDRFHSAPRLLVWALGSAWQAGNMTRELRSFADQYQQRAETTLPVLGQIVEAVAIPIVGVAVGLTVLSMFMPLIKILQEMGAN
jgi:type IV pilus assembly protein PilC